MKLDRNIDADGMGKYALLKLRRLKEYRDTASAPAIKDAFNLLVSKGILDWGVSHTESEFFVMRLKDKYAYRGLMGYLKAIELEDKPDAEYAQEILDMANRAGINSPFCKLPD